MFSMQAPPNQSPEIINCPKACFQAGAFDAAIYSVIARQAKLKIDTWIQPSAGISRLGTSFVATRETLN